MKINRLHTIIGILLIIIPFTGFTRGFKYGFSVVAGGVILFFAMKSIHHEIMKKQHRYRRHDSYAESRPREDVSKIKEETQIGNLQNIQNERDDSSGHIADDSISKS